MKIKVIIIGLIVVASSCSKGQQSEQVESSIEIDNSVLPSNNITFKNQLGINGFEWDFFDADNSIISAGRMNVINSFGGFRHYMDWEKIESNEGQYTFNPVHSGGWNYDLIYERCKTDGIEMLACLKNSPPWLVSTYPGDQRDAENVPAPYGLPRTDPASYIKQAKAGFQFAARYGHNTNVDPKLVTVNPNKRWPADPVNQVKIGLGYINYIECNNEPDKNWKGPKAEQSAEEYAANMSAFYDGNMGKLGNNVGVKTADPTMKVVMGGLSVSTMDFVLKMIEWCKKNRGYKADGSVNLCFDIINYHYYSNNGTTGIAPEFSEAAKKADEYVAMSKKNANSAEIWMTEAGYDLNTASNQRAIKIGDKDAILTQADWMLRSALLYGRHGVNKTFFYMLDDVDINSTIQYSSSGFAVGYVRRPVADYFVQTKKLIGDFSFYKNISNEPIVDIYSLKDRKIYVLYVPDQKGRTAQFTLDLGGAKNGKVYTLVAGADNMTSKIIPTTNGKLDMTLTETPIFVEAN